MLTATACTATYANGNVKNGSNNSNALVTTLQQVKEKIASAPSGTTYGVVESKNGNVVVNTPLGKYNIERKSDGSYSFMGMKARLLSAKDGVYVVKTSLGTWAVNTRKCTVKKK